MIKKIGIALIAIIVTFAIVIWVIDQPKPEGKIGPEADQLARKMELATNKAAWDSIRYIKWTFKGIHTFIWDKANALVLVKSKDAEVVINTQNREGLVLNKEEGANDQELIEKAYAYFANDSFWLVAHYKAFDPGTTRAIVNTEEGDALLVFYSSGGVTPGDSYLWYLDETGKPYKWEMWVQMIPVGGLSFSWENWKTIDGGAMLPQMHKGPTTIEISNVESATNVEALNNGINPFEEMLR